MDEAGRRQRAEIRRGTMTLRKTDLADDVDPAPVRGEEALSLVTRLTREGWSLAALDEPVYLRREIRVRFVPRQLA
jgi:hypothetical protein